MTYTFEHISPQLIFIRWHTVADKLAARRWLDDIATSLDNATEPQYYISDLRRGYVDDVSVLRKHGELTRHPNYGGGVTLGDDFRSGVYVSTASRLGERGTIASASTRDELQRMLERMQPGVTAQVDLAALFG